MMSPTKKGCVFCHRNSSDDLQMGKLHTFERSAVHYYCLLFSSGLVQNGKSDDDGVVGFLPTDIRKEMYRGKRLRCNGCRKGGATIGCCQSRCRKVFHLPCAQDRDALCQFFGTFRTYCSEHRPRQDIKSEELAVLKSCNICFGDIDWALVVHILFPPCCRNGVFHRLCIQKQAISAGYFHFKCPLCNNKDAFQEEMLRFGVYIPEQDASWERENNAFQELYMRHSQCDVKVCRCPDGRSYNSDSGCWRILLCTVCGSQGCHIKCRKVKGSQPYECRDCKAISNNNNEESLPTVDQTPPPPVLEVQSPVNELDIPRTCTSTTMTIQQFLGGHYAQSGVPLIYIEGCGDEDESAEEQELPTDTSLVDKRIPLAPFSKRYTCIVDETSPDSSSNWEQSESSDCDTNGQELNACERNSHKAESDKRRVSVCKYLSTAVLEDKVSGQSTHMMGMTGNMHIMTFSDDLIPSVRQLPVDDQFL